MIVTTTDSAFVDSEQDLSEVLSFLSETYGSFHSLRNWSLTRMGDWRYGGNHRFIKTDPDFFSRNMHVWREGPKIIGLAISERGEEMTVQVGPDERPLEESILGWVEDQWGREKDRIAVKVFANDEWRQNILRKRGYRTAGSTGFLRRYDTLFSPRKAPLENGFSLFAGSGLHLGARTFFEIDDNAKVIQFDIRPLFFGGLQYSH